MGYKKSFNLVTIQLIIPLSTMTKAEYKNAYGIDLDDIDIEKVTLLQDEGDKNKYFVDEVKTTESGIDIYAGGKILSIGSSVSVVNNAYSVENAKPIYYHGINMGSSDNKKSFQFTIINNSSEKIDTLAKIRAWAESIDGVVLMPGNGCIFVDDSYKSLHVIVKALNNTYELYYVDSTTGSTKVTSTNLSDYFANVQDYVNKLN